MARLHTHLILKTDGERAIVRLLKESLKRIKTDVADQASFEHPPPYDSRSNGSIENALKQVQGHLRTLKLSVEKRFGKTVPNDHAVVSWLVEHAAWLLTVGKRGDDGRTAYHRIRGRNFRGVFERCEAGEAGLRGGAVHQRLDVLGGADVAALEADVAVRPRGERLAAGADGIDLVAGLGAYRQPERLERRRSIDRQGQAGLQRPGSSQAYGDADDLVESQVLHLFWSSR